ncbi:UBP-type zinc finger domain-containing protein [Arthrobacter crystallopoietes]
MRRRELSRRSGFCLGFSHSQTAGILPEWSPSAGHAGWSAQKTEGWKMENRSNNRPIPGISLSSVPSGTGCLECLSGAEPGWWVHLRRCAQCGHIGCCDSSPSQHASAHARTLGHPVITSYEPEEDWFYETNTKKFFRGPRLPDPQSRPLEQPVPAPAEKVPTDWRERIHR